MASSKLGVHWLLGGFVLTRWHDFFIEKCIRNQQMVSRVSQSYLPKRRSINSSSSSSNRKNQQTWSFSWSTRHESLKSKRRTLEVSSSTKEFAISESLLPWVAPLPAPPHSSDWNGQNLGWGNSGNSFFVILVWLPSKVRNQKKLPLPLNFLDILDNSREQYAMRCNSNWAFLELSP